MLSPFDGTLIADDDDLFMEPLVPIPTDKTVDQFSKKKDEDFEELWNGEEELFNRKRKYSEESSLSKKPRFEIELPMPELPMPELPTPELGVTKRPMTSKPKVNIGTVHPLLIPKSRYNEFSHLPLELAIPIKNLESIIDDIPFVKLEKSNTKNPVEKKTKKEPKQKFEAPLPKSSNTRDRPINRCTLKEEDIPESLMEFMKDRILKKTKTMYERDPSKGPYQGVTPYVSHGIQTGWGAQLQNKNRGQMIRIGTFDNIEVAAIAFTAAYIDRDLIDEPLKGRDWIESMCKKENSEELEDWILLNSLGK